MLPGRSIASGNRCRPGSTVMRPRIECDCFSIARGQFVVAQRHQPLGFLRRGDPDDAGAIAGQRHEHARAMRRVEFGRDVACGRAWPTLKVSAVWLSSRRVTAMPAASRHSECRPSAPTTSRAESLSAAAVRIDDGIVVDDDSFGLVVEPDETGQFGGARFQRRHQRRGFRCCSRTHRGRFRRQENRTSGARISRPVSSTSRIDLERGRLVLAAGPDVQPLAGNRRSRRAAPWSGCRHRARGARPARSVRRPAASAIAARSPAGPPPTTATS